MASSRGPPPGSDYLHENLLAEDQPPGYRSDNYEQYAPRHRLPANPFLAEQPPPPPVRQDPAPPAPARRVSAPRQVSASARLVMAIDFGTTFTGTLDTLPGLRGSKIHL